MNAKRWTLLLCLVLTACQVPDRAAPSATASPALIAGDIKSATATLPASPTAEPTDTPLPSSTPTRRPSVTRTLWPSRSPRTPTPSPTPIVEADRIVHYRQQDWTFSQNIPSVSMAWIDGALWVGGHDLYRFDGQDWTQFVVAEFIKDFPPEGGVWAIAAIPGQGLWIGTSRGAAYFDGQTWSTCQDPQGLLSQDIQNIAVTQDRVVWFGGYTSMARFDGKNWTYFPGESEESFHIAEMVAAPQGGVWFSGPGSSLGHWNGKTTKSYELPVEQRGESRGDIHQIEVAPDHSLWVLSETHVINHFKAGVVLGHYTTLTNVPMDWDSQHAANIRSIGVSPNGTLWVGPASYGRGILSFDGKSWTLYDQLPFKYVFDFAFESDQVIWVGTERGVYRFTPGE